MQLSLVANIACQGRVSDLTVGQARDGPLDRGVLERPHRHRRRLVQLAGEEQSAGVGGQSSREDLIRVRLRQRDRTPPVEHRLPHAAVDRDRTHQPRRRLNVRVVLVGSLPTRAVGERQQPALRQRAPAEEHRARRARHRKLRMLDDPLLRERTNPAQKRPAGAAPDQVQAILDQKGGDELIVAGRGRVLNRLDRQPLRPEPLGGTSVNRSRRVRVERGKLSLRILGEQRVDPKPAAPIRPRDELV